MAEPSATNPVMAHVIEQGGTPLSMVLVADVRFIMWHGDDGYVVSQYHPHTGFADMPMPDYETAAIYMGDALMSALKYLGIQQGEIEDDEEELSTETLQGFLDNFDSPAHQRERAERDEAKAAWNEMWGSFDIIQGPTVEECLADGLFQIPEIDLDRVARLAPEGLRFPPGRIVMTANCAPHLGQEEAEHLLVRFFSGDWGETKQYKDDAKMNSANTHAQEGTILAQYSTGARVKIWVHWNPGITTLMLPEDY